MPIESSPPSAGPDTPDTDALKQLVTELMTPAAIAGLQAHPAFADAARGTLDGWAPQPGDERHINRTLQDVGLFMAGLWVMQLAAEPEGLTHTSLSAVLAAWGVASRGRVGAMLTYLQFRRMIEPAPSGDRRSQRYRPTPALSALLGNWFERELKACALVRPDVAPVLGAWDQSAVRDRYIAAYSRLMLGAHLAHARPEDSLDVFSHRRSGLTVLGQILIDAGFPDAGPVRLNHVSIARRADVSRGHIRSLVLAGERAGFLVRDPDGLTTLSEDLQRHVRDFLPMYWLGLAWAAGAAMAGEGNSGA
ncbi:hypothetical protein QO010_000053 [Caulobacter ginsengisoli]|uniref:MarR family transcriptional regulator n=1 Tax=Caulobacter ginsengisoli TaxID=400775 RepID=A0ABU0IJX4_9CAUL|nr:hypothetical protein [Caulobacter ginsengisoli]MDQ0462305.1 hypothetical protein [Caulobacter ginsengisoli]